MKDQEFLPLDDYEKELIQAIENEDFAPLERSEFIKQKAMLQEAAKNTISNRTTRKAITFKPDPKVLELFKLKANNEGVKYQTLLNAVMYKYATGKLISK